MQLLIFVIVAFYVLCTSLILHIIADEKVSQRLCIKKKWQFDKTIGGGAGSESITVSVMVDLWCKRPKALQSNHTLLLSVIVQTFEVKPFSVCETRHLQRK